MRFGEAESVSAWGCVERGDFCTVVGAPTICRCITCVLTTCMGVHFQRKAKFLGVHFQRGKSSQLTAKCGKLRSRSLPGSSRSAFCSGSEGPSPEGDGFGRHKHAQSAEADFRSRPDRRLSAAVLRRFRSLRDLLKASPKGEGFHPSPMGTLILLRGVRMARRLPRRDRGLRGMEDQHAFGRRIVQARPARSSSTLVGAYGGTFERCSCCWPWAGSLRTASRLHATVACL